MGVSASMLYSSAGEALSRQIGTGRKCMKDAAQSMRREMEGSHRRMRELETKLAALPADAGPEILALYEKLLVKEQKYQARMALAMAPPPEKKKATKLWVTIALLLLVFFIYLKVSKQA
jgi:hypothetical protein